MNPTADQRKAIYLAVDEHFFSLKMWNCKNLNAGAVYNNSLKKSIGVTSSIQMELLVLICTIA